MCRVWLRLVTTCLLNDEEGDPSSQRTLSACLPR